MFRLIEGFRESESKISARVEEHRARLAAETGLTGRALADRLAREVIDQAALTSMLISAGAALPLALPLLGPWVSTAVTVLTGAVLQTANELTLCYALAATYRVHLPAERMRMAAFWLVKLTNYEDVRERALTMGVRLTVRKLVEKLIVVALARAVATTAGNVMQGMMVRSTTTAPAPWYVRATGFAAVPVLAWLSWRSTQGVGTRAREYFADLQSH